MRVVFEIRVVEDKKAYMIQQKVTIRGYQSEWKVISQ
jgi:hypothetical protein